MQSKRRGEKEREMERREGGMKRRRQGGGEGGRRVCTIARGLLPHSLAAIPAHRSTPLGERRNVEGTTRDLRQDLAIRFLQLLCALLP